MPNWLVEFLYVFALSKRTQWALIFGLVFFGGIHLVGAHVLSNFELEGSTKQLQDIIVHRIAKRYDKLALFTLFSFLILAYKCYQKDKKRFW
jgi:hypothetical protein